MRSIAAQYAQALDMLVRSDPEHCEKYLANLKQALDRRGHGRLLPAIIAEVLRFEHRRDRLTKYMAVTPERVRTRVLTELYRKLVTSR